jgi:hypothetical protein
VTCPLLVIHGAKDKFIPIQQGRDLFSAAPGASASGMQKQFVELPECDHNDIGQRNAVEYRAALDAFLQKVAPDMKKAEEKLDAGQRTHQRQPRPRRTRDTRPDAPKTTADVPRKTTEDEPPAVKPPAITQP